MVKQEVKDEPTSEDDNGRPREDLWRNVSLHPAVTENVTSEIKQEVEIEPTLKDDSGGLEEDMGENVTLHPPIIT